MKNTRGVKNKVIKHSDYYEMRMLNKDSDKSCYFDHDDYDLVTKYIWKMDKQGYIYTYIKHDNGDRRRIVMHRLILDVIDYDCLVDHRDLAKNNNRKSNIRIANKSKNEINKPLTSLNKSGIRGISYRKERGTWASETAISIDGKMKRIRKSFPLFDDAVRHRVFNEATLFKQFSPNHNPATNTIQLNYISHDDNLPTFIEVDMEGNVIKFEKQQTF